MPYSYLKNKQIMELAFRLREIETREQLEAEFLNKIQHIYDDSSFYICSEIPENSHQKTIPLNKGEINYGYLAVPESDRFDEITWKEWELIATLLAEMISVNKKIKISRMMAAKLQKSEEKYRLLIENATDVVFKFNVSSKSYDYMSPVSIKLFGIEQDDLYKDPDLIKTLLPENWSNYFENNWKQVNKGALPDYYDYPIIHNVTRKLRWLHQSNDWLKDKEGNIIALQGRIEDITSRKLIEQSLQINEKRYERVQKMGHVGNWEFDPVTNYFWASAETKKIFGADPDSQGFSKKMIDKCIPESDRVDQALLELLKNDEGYVLEYDIFTMDTGEKKSLQSIAEVERDKDGNPVKVNGVILDVTEIKKQSIELEKSMNLFRGIYEQSPIGIQIFDKDGILTKINKKGLEILGVDHFNKLHDFNIWEVENISQQKKLELKQGKTVYFSSCMDMDEAKRNHLSPTNKKGTLYIDSYAIPLMKENIIDGFMVQFQDVTQRVESEKLAIAEKNRAETYLNIANVILLGLDNNGDIKMINPKGCQVLGCSYEDIIGKNWINNFIPERFREEFLEILHKVNPGEIEDITYNENLIVTQSGEERLIAWSNSEVKNNSGEIVGTLSSGHDITEQRKAEQALKESEKQLKQAQAIGMMGNYKIDLATGLISGSEETKKIYGLESFDTIKTEKIQELHLPEYREMLDISLTKLITQGIPYDVEFKLKKADSAEIVDVHSLARFNKEENSIVGVIQDITERVRAKQAIIDSEQKFKALYDNAPLSYQSLNEDGTFRDVNPTWLKTLGYERDEVIGKSFGDFLHPDWKPHFAKNFPAFKKRGYVSGVEFRIRQKNGNYIDISFEGCIAYNPDGSVRQTYCVFKDITNQKQAELALKESEERYHTLFQNTDEGIIIANVNDFTFEYANPAICRILGYSFDEILNLAVADIHPEDTQEYAKKLFEKLGKNEVDRVEALPFKTKSGETVYMDVNASIIKIKGEVKLAGFFTDITERKLAGEELAKHREHLEELVKERTAELREKNAELERFNSLFVGREFRIKELRDKVKRLEEKFGKQ